MSEQRGAAAPGLTGEERARKEGGANEGDGEVGGAPEASGRQSTSDEGRRRQ